MATRDKSYLKEERLVEHKKKEREYCWCKALQREDKEGMGRVQDVGNLIETEYKETKITLPHKSDMAIEGVNNCSLKGYRTLLTEASDYCKPG